VQLISDKLSICPWGTFTILDEREFCKVKRIEVNPGGRLSLQSHNKRAEAWTIVSGIGSITLGDEIKDYGVGETILIPIGVKHRIENKQNEPVIFIEVQTGTYFGEDDIIRYDDIYGRL